MPAYVWGKQLAFRYTGGSAVATADFFVKAAVNNTTATWQEDLASTDTTGRSAVGINPAGQANHDIQALVAGTLIGLAGGAIISAVQEFLHVIG